MAPAHLWKPGQSGNPGGRPKRLDDVKELARSHTVDAIKRLAYWMNSKKNSRVSVAASQALLERAWLAGATPDRRGWRGWANNNYPQRHRGKAVGVGEWPGYRALHRGRQKIK